MFNASNNEVEYEVLIVGIELCYTAGAHSVRAFSDSQLNGEHEAKDDAMATYVWRVREATGLLKHFTITQSVRELVGRPAVEIGKLLRR